MSDTKCYCGREWDHPLIASLRSDRTRLMLRCAGAEASYVAMTLTLTAVMKEHNEEEAELAALKARRCETCCYREHWPEEGPEHLSEMPLACTSCFGLSRWQPPEEAQP